MASVNVRIDQTRGASYCHQNIPKSKNTTLRQWPSCVLGSVGVCLCPVRPTNFFWLFGCLLVGCVFCASRRSAEPVQLEQTRLRVQQVSEWFIAKEEMFEDVLIWSDSWYAKRDVQVQCYEMWTHGELWGSCHTHLNSMDWDEIQVACIFFWVYLYYVYRLNIRWIQATSQMFKNGPR